MHCERGARGISSWSRNRWNICSVETKVWQNNRPALLSGKITHSLEISQFPANPVSGWHPAIYQILRQKYSTFCEIAKYSGENILYFADGRHWLARKFSGLFLGCRCLPSSRQFTGVFWNLTKGFGIRFTIRYLAKPQNSSKHHNQIYGTNQIVKFDHCFNTPYLRVAMNI